MALSATMSAKQCAIYARSAHFGASSARVVLGSRAVGRQSVVALQHHYHHYHHLGGSVQGTTA